MALWAARGRRLLSGLGTILSVVGITALFGAGATLGLIAHLNQPAGRRVTASFLTSTLADIFQGTITVGRIVQVSAGEVEAEDVVVRDEQQHIVLKVTRLTAQANVADIVRRVLGSEEKLTIVVDHVRVERAEADLIPAGDGLPTLAHALMPRPSTQPKSPGEPERYVRVWLPAVEIGQGFARGRISDSPTLEADISGVHGSLLATPKGAAIDVERFSLLARGLGGADAKGVATLHIRAPGAVWSSFDGYMGDVQFGSTVRWQDDKLDLKLDLPHAEPAAARALLAKWPLIKPAEARLHLQGKPPDFDVDVQATVGDVSKLSATGNLNVASPMRLRLDVEGRQLDLRALWPQAPATSIDVDTDLGVHSEKGQVLVDVSGALKPTSVGTFQIPAVDFSGNAVGATFSGEAKVHDRGLPLDLGFSIYPDGKIELVAEAKRVNLAEVERIKPYFDGSGSADMKVHAAFDHGRLDTNLTLDMRGVSYQGVALQSGRLTAGAKGSLDKVEQLALDAKLTGKQLTAGRFAFADVSASARGPLFTPQVTTTLKDPLGPSVDAKATVAIGTPLSMREVTVGVSRDNVEIRGDVARLDLASDRVLVSDLKLHGASGELHGNAEITPAQLSVNAQGQNLDLSAFSRVMGLPRGALEGRASVNVDAVAGAHTQRGTVELSVSKASVANLSGISGQLSAQLEGRHLKGTSLGNVEALGAFSADWDTELAGPPTERASFEHATGEATLSLEQLQLAYVAQAFPEDDLDVDGVATLSIKAKRSEPKAIPDIAVSARTQGLSVRLARPKQPPLNFSGIELSASANLDGASGNTSVALSADQGSERLLTSSVDMTLDVAAALAGKAPFEKQIQERPLLAKVVVPRLDLDNLPLAMRIPNLRGVVRVEGTVRGTVNEPVASLGVRASDLRFGINGRSEPVDVCGTAEYAKVGGAFSVGAELFLPGGFEATRTPCSGKRVANVRLTGSAPYDAKLGRFTWSGTALASLEALPLTTVPQLADARVTGTASGKLLLDRSGLHPNASGQLSLADLRVDRFEVGNGSLKLRSDAEHARVDFQVERGQTSVSGNVTAGVSWASELPGLDDAEPIDFGLHAVNLEASALEPFLADFMSELRGRLDGDLNARLQPLAKGEEARKVDQLGGKVSMRDGSLVLSGLGYRLRDVDFSATARRDGTTTLVDIPDLAASAGSKVQNLRANLAFRLAGFDIVSGSGRVRINGLPLVVDGITRANADAYIDKLDIKRFPEKMFVDIHFQELTARLPEQESRQLIELNENENITLLQPVAQPKASREDSVPWQFAIHLGQNAKVERGALLDLPISGDPNVVLASGVGVTGSVMLERRGAVQMLGKIFQIEGGALVFDTPDPSDPRLDVRASWRSPDGDTLFMYISGTISKPRVQFDRPQDQALALLLGGSDSGSTANIGVGALDTLLADTPLARVQLRGKDSDDVTKGATYTAAYRASDRVIVEGNYQAAAATSGDQTGGTIGAAVDYRMTKTVSVRAQLGTIGTGVDLVYQYRY